MKKILLIVLFLSFLVSCGPHRMKCGPGRRCVIEVYKKDSNPEIKNS